LVAGAAGLGVYARWIEPTWVRVVRQDLPVAGLAPAWVGASVALVADLHLCSWGVPADYLASAFDRVQSLGADLVAAAGDYIYMDEPAYGAGVAALFKRLSAPLGVFACLGNHDYGVSARVTIPAARPVAMAKALGDVGVRVLANESLPLTRGGQTLWIAGMGDLWAGHLRPVEALKDVPIDAPKLILCHNPDGAEDIDLAGGGTILSGHTHGGQVQVPLLGPPILPVTHRDRYEGLHHVGKSWLYITRGLGCTPFKVRFNCRPEISLLTLRPAPGER
jgi:hypothetical protein